MSAFTVGAADRARRRRRLSYALAARAARNHTTELDRPGAVVLPADSQAAPPLTSVS